MIRKIISASLIIVCLMSGYMLNQIQGSARAYDDSSNGDVFNGKYGDEYFLDISLLDSEYTPNYSEGTYKLISDSEKIELYEQPSYDSAVCMTISANTYHNISRYNGYYGYVEVKDGGGWLKMSSARKLNIDLNEAQIETANDAVSTLELYADCDKELVLEYTEIISTLQSLDELTSEDGLDSVINKLSYDAKTVRDVASFMAGELEELPRGYRYVGDVYFDNVINMKDLVYMQRHIARLITLDYDSIIASDVDASREIDMVDAVLFQRFMAAFFDEFNAGFIYHISVR